jgi:hypothetical protein
MREMKIRSAQSRVSLSTIKSMFPINTFFEKLPPHSKTEFRVFKNDMFRLGQKDFLFNFLCFLFWLFPALSLAFTIAAISILLI